MEELFQRVTNGLENCIESIEEAECPEDCPYQRGCWGTDAGQEIDPMNLQLMKDAQALIERQEKELKKLRMDKEELLREVNRNVTISVGHGISNADYYRTIKNIWGERALEKRRKRDLKEQLIEFCDSHGIIVYRQDMMNFAEDDVSRLTASMTVLLPQGVERTLPDGIVKIKEEGYHGAGEAADLHGGNDGGAESAAGGQAGNAGGAHAGHCGGCEACQCDGEEKCVREE